MGVGGLGGGTVSLSSSPFIFQTKERSGASFPASQVLCSVPDEAIGSVRKVGPPGPGPPRFWCLPTIGSVKATVEVAMPGCLFLRCLPSFIVGHGVASSHRVGSTRAVQMGVLRSGILPPGSYHLAVPRGCLSNEPQASATHLKSSWNLALKATRQSSGPGWHGGEDGVGVGRG